MDFLLVTDRLTALTAQWLQYTRAMLSSFWKVESKGLFCNAPASAKLLKSGFSRGFSLLVAIWKSFGSVSF